MGIHFKEKHDLHSLTLLLSYTDTFHLYLVKLLIKLVRQEFTTNILFVIQNFCLLITKIKNKYYVLFINLNYNLIYTLLSYLYKTPFQLIVITGV